MIFTIDFGGPPLFLETPHLFGSLRVLVVHCGTVVRILGMKKKAMLQIDASS